MPDPNDRSPIDIEIGSALRVARKAAGFSQGRIAAAAGVSAQQVGKYERGEDSLRPGRMVQLAGIVGVSAVSLMPASAHRVIQTAEEAEQLPAEALEAGWRSDAAGKPVRVGMAEAA